MEQGVLGGVLAALVALRLAASASADANPLVQYSFLGATGLLSLFALWRLYRSIIKPMAAELKRQENLLQRERRQRATLQWRQEKTNDFLAQQGIVIPSEIRWGSPPAEYIRAALGEEVDDVNAA